MSETRKRSRKRFGGHAHKKPKGSRELEVGAQGVLITCNMNERKCTSEAFSLLNEYADALYGPEQPADTQDSLSEEEEDDEDAEAALKKEVSQIQMSMKTHQQRFTAVDSGANNVVFIRTHGVGLVGKLNPLNKVDLTNPELSIIIEIIKTVCCVSVLKDYMLFRKYNLQEVAKEPTNQSTGPQEAANQSTGLQEAANQSTGPQEATNQSTGPQEAANQSTGPQEAANQSTGPQEATNQSTGLQEAANQSTGPQEAANQTQERGDGEKADGSAESHDVSAGNGTKEAELE